MWNLPPLTQVCAFEAAARHLSLKLAAAELGVTPTAISHQINCSRDTVGSLSSGAGPVLALSWAGEQLFPIFRDGLEAIAEALATVRAGSESGRLRVTTTNAFAARWLVPRRCGGARCTPGLSSTSSAPMPHLV